MKNPNTKARNTKQYQNTKFQNSKHFKHLYFGDLNLFRISNFEFRIFNKKGNTLIELLMYMGIFVILLGVLLEMFGSVIDQQINTEATSSVEEDGQYILTRLTYDIQRAQSISLPVNPGDSSSSLQIIIGGTPFTYSLTSNNLQVITGGNTDVLNGYDTTVSNLLFKRLGNPNGKPTINMSFTVTSKVIKHSGNESQTYTTTVGTR